MTIHNLDQWKDWSFEQMMSIYDDYTRQFDDAIKHKNLTAARKFFSLSSQALAIAETKIAD